MTNNRFVRTQMLLGEQAMKNLAKTKIMLIGLGAVGGYVLEGLARAGVGNFVLVDFDSFEESNINRQILATTETLGQKKIEVAKNRVLSINPKANVETRDIFVNAETIEDLLACKPDFVIDAIDALNPKCDLIQALYIKQLPFISSMGAALKTDVSKIRYGNLSNSKNCSLAKFVRKRLRKRGIDIAKIKCVWSDELVDLPDTALDMPVNVSEMGRVRHTLGSLPTITAIFGLVIANQTILELSSSKN
ncbi:MAG: tRNA threonylcarbamoyladenosine dehydratase [Alphaproteobacteria bacterium]|nr:tRNA threonylcarbamoyladenosine dehydratase [Alphaproteobacteria bacterium]